MRGRDALSSRPMDVFDSKKVVTFRRVCALQRRFARPVGFAHKVDGAHNNWTTRIPRCLLKRRSKAIYGEFARGAMCAGWQSERRR